MKKSSKHKTNEYSSDTEEDLNCEECNRILHKRSCNSLKTIQKEFLDGGFVNKNNVNDYNYLSNGICSMVYSKDKK